MAGFVIYYKIKHGQDDAPEPHEFIEKRTSAKSLKHKEYIANVKKNLRNQLNNIDMVNDDGSVENLGEKYGNKKRNS